MHPTFKFQNASKCTRFVILSFHFNNYYYNNNLLIPVGLNLDCDFTCRFNYGLLGSIQVLPWVSQPLGYSQRQPKLFTLMVPKMVVIPMATQNNP